MNSQERSDWMLYVSCMTYNQAPFIVDALNGFTMQRTDFPYVCAIVDDASTDGEQEVIQNYINEYFDLEDNTIVRQTNTNDYKLIFARHKTNHNCYFAVFYLKYNHYSIKKNKRPYVSEWLDKAKYIATCEGDDYWIDNMKLQKQVDFMELNHDISYTCTRFNILDQNTGVIKLSPNRYFDDIINEGSEYYEFTRNEAFRGDWITKPLTCVYRKDCDNIDRKNFAFFRDVYLIYFLLSKGNGACFSFVSGVYRLNELSTYGGKSEMEKKKQNYLAYEELFKFTNDKQMLMTTANLYIDLFVARYQSYKIPRNLVQLFSVLVYWPLRTIKRYVKLLLIK